MIWDSATQTFGEPSAEEREHAMGFPTGTTAAPMLSEQDRCQVLGQAMDLNCLTWILSLGLAEQRRLHTDHDPSLDSVRSMPIGTLQASAGGEARSRVHPWTTWDVLDELVASAGPTVDQVGASTEVKEVADGRTQTTDQVIALSEAEETVVSDEVEELVDGEEETTPSAERIA